MALKEGETLRWQQVRWFVRLRHATNLDHARDLSCQNQLSGWAQPERRVWDLMYSKRSLNFTYLFHTLAEARKAVSTIAVIKRRLKQGYFAEIVEARERIIDMPSDQHQTNWRREVEEVGVVLRRGKIPPLLALALEAE